jgi:hypothetical protein
MKVPKLILFTIMMVMIAAGAKAQVTVDLKIRNQRIQHDSLYFDVYMERTGSNDLYLGNADFVLTYDNTNFSSPVLSYIANSAVLKNSSGSSISTYESGIATSIGTGTSANRLIINVQPPAFSNQTDFNNNIAKIDNSAKTHYLGTFAISGMQSLTRNPNLQWVMSASSGVKTKVFTIANTTPWRSTQATATGVNPSLSTEPTTQNTNLAITSRTNTSITLSWTAGNGSSRIIFAKASSAVGSNSPADGINYTADTIFTHGSQINTTGIYVVYKNGGTSATITGLTANTRYYFSAYDFNGTDGNSENFLTSSADTISGYTLTPKPTVQASNAAISAFTTTGLTLNWKAGNGSNSIVIAHSGSAVTHMPADGTSYSANAAFGSGTDLGSGDYVMYDGTDTTVAITGLTANTNYYFSVFTHNGNGTTTSYLITSPATANRTTLQTEPTTQASLASVSAFTTTTETVSWKTGNGAYSVVVAKQGSAVTANPVDGTAYTGNAAFTSGENLGSGNYVVYSGTDTTVAVTGLTAGTDYYYAVYTFNGTSGASNYNTTSPATTHRATSAAEPTTASTSLTYSAFTTNSLTLNFTAGNGANRVIVAHAGAAVDANPVDGTPYTANATMGSGDQIGTGNYVVYNGSSNTATISGLNPAIQYYFTVYEYNGSSTTTNYLTSSVLSGSRYTLDTESTTQATAANFTAFTTSSLSLSWTKGSGAYSIVVAKQASAVNSNPVDGTGYTANAAFGSGTQLGSGNYVVYSGNGSSVTVTGLSANTEYYFAVYTFNNANEAANYLTTSPATANRYTSQSEPTVASSSMVFSALGTSTFTATWTKGNGARRIVLIKESSNVDTDPSDGTGYTANAAYTSGDQIGTGNYVVYDGTDSTVTITGLNQDKTYYLKVYEYNGTTNTANYLTSSVLAANQNTYLTLSVKVALEGAYSGSAGNDTMTTELNRQGLLPTAQPYNTAPWSYSGTETVTSIPNANVVDWVYVELRQANSASAATSSTVKAKAVGFLLKDGSIVGTDGTSALTMPISASGNFYVVIYHRNHIPVISNANISFSTNKYVYDFTTGATTAYSSTLVDVSGSGYYALYGGSVDNSTGSVFVISAADRNAAWNDRNKTGVYYMTDANLDGNVDAADRSIILNNTSKASLVP